MKRKEMFSFLLLLLFMLLFFNCFAENVYETSAIDGEWFVEFNSNDIGWAQTVLTFNTNGNEFYAHTRKNATNDILGFWKSSFAKMFTKGFKHGALLNITDGILEAKDDKIVLRAIFRSAIGNYYFNGEIKNDILTAELISVNGQNKGTITGYKANKKLPLFDYPKIIAEALAMTDKKVFNREIFTTKEWKVFEKKIRKNSLKMKDDVEMVFSFYYFANNLPMSHYSLFRSIPTDKTQSELRAEIKNNVYLEQKSDKTVYLEIKSFMGSAVEIDSVFSVIKKGKYENLIVDLRNNTGGFVDPGMEFARNVVDTTIVGGIFLTQKWYNEHQHIPTLEQYDEFMHFSESNYDMLIAGIHEEMGLVLEVVPSKEYFAGNVFILTNQNTASTCEPIVYSLKKAKQATIVGEKTAGAMMNGETFELSNNYALIVPTADYFASDGYRIDQNGVLPDIEVPGAEALEYVLKNLIAD